MNAKKKGLYFDSLFPKGHRKYNYSMVKLFSLQYDLDVINYNHYYDELELPSNCNIINFKGDKSIEQLGIAGRIRSYSLIKQCKKIFKKGHYDFLIIATFDVFVMLMANHLFSKKGSAPSDPFLCGMRFSFWSLKLGKLALLILIHVEYRGEYRKRKAHDQHGQNDLERRAAENPAELPGADAGIPSSVGNSHISPSLNRVRIFGTAP